MRKAAVANSRTKRTTSDRITPTRICGFGEPIFVGRGEDRRLLADGAGLCSPGLWPPERRFEPKGVALLVDKALSYELDRLGGRSGGGLLRVFSDLASGRLRGVHSRRRSSPA